MQRRCHFPKWKLFVGFLEKSYKLIDDGLIILVFLREAILVLDEVYDQVYSVIVAVEVSNLLGDGRWLNVILD